MAAIFLTICATSGRKIISATRMQEEKFVPKPYIGKTTGNTGKKKKAEKKPAEKKKPEPKPAPEKKPSTDGQMSLLDFSVAKAG